MEKDRKTMIFLSLAMVFLTGILIILALNPPVTAKAIDLPSENQYSFAKAVCSGNMCQDYEVVCKNKELISMTPISEKIYFSVEVERLPPDKEPGQECKN